MPEEKRWGKCYTCEREITEEQENKSHELSGFSLCEVCLEDEIKPKERCCICHKSGVELNTCEGSEDKKICLACFKLKQEGGVETMGELSSFAKRNSQFISLTDGESIEATYKSFKIGANTYQPDKEVVMYQFETEYGLKTLRSGACGLARLFDNIQKGSKIRLTRHGMGNQTSYNVEIEQNDEWVVVGKEKEEEE